MRVPDEGKLPVSWLAGNQGEYATSTEVILMILMILMMPKMVIITHKEGDGVYAALAVN